LTLSIHDRASEAARYINSKSGTLKPRVAVVLGSGLGGVADSIVDSITIAYDEIPHFVRSTVQGHAGCLIVGKCAGVDVILMKGRFHFYEGYSMEEITLPIRVFALIGATSLLLTNAAGGCSEHLGAGSLMLITDHLNLMGDNPLRGANDERFGPRFPDMTDVYTPSCISIAHEVARELGIKVAEGVYVGLRGPSYETPAEVKMLRKLGGDALGMSTVPEAIVARHSGMQVLGISCITNVAAGMSGSPINHEEVIEVGARAGRELARLIVGIIPRLAAV
jgi:purine-nucleoside phosphorylase